MESLLDVVPPSRVCVVLSLQQIFLAIFVKIRILQVLKCHDHLRRFLTHTWKPWSDSWRLQVINTIYTTQTVLQYNFEYNVLVYDTIYREVALAHLLTLVDIPMLEQILSYERSAQKQASCRALTFSNNSTESLSAEKRCNQLDVHRYTTSTKLVWYFRCECW